MLETPFLWLESLSGKVHHIAQSVCRTGEIYIPPDKENLSGGTTSLSTDSQKG